LTLALVPNVVAFTAPMAALVGVIIGLSKMQSDNELVAIRASGVGNAQITLPIFILGCVLSVLAFAINLYGVPLAARIVRQVAIQTAIYKLESPIEPGVFNTEIAGYTIYVKDGDLANGQWKNIFVHNEDEKTGTVRMITSQKGRIDTSGELSELVLENAVATTFNRQPVSKNSSRSILARFGSRSKREEAS
jgi:lipopolysaccharide export LptBFGC system permease protein LptF